MVRHAVEAAFDRRSLDFARRRPHAPAMARRPQIVAFGGGGFSMEPGNPLLDDYVLGLTGVERPRVCFVPTASGDADHYIVRFYRAFAGVDLRAVARLAVPARQAAAGSTATSPATCSRRTSSTSAAAASCRCSASGARTASTRSCASAWQRGRRPVRPERRLAVLVPGGAHRVPRRARRRIEGLGLLP